MQAAPATLSVTTNNHNGHHHDSMRTPQHQPLLQQQQQKQLGKGGSSSCGNSHAIELSATELPSPVRQHKQQLEAGIMQQLQRTSSGNGRYRTYE